jgi:Zn-dependent M28 family amino/carboxypeptidase
MNTRRLPGLSAILITACVLVTGRLEAATAGPAVDAKALMEDVRVLSSPAFAGRKTGTEGSKLAQAYIAQRYAQLGLQPFGASYSMPFAFTHDSKRALVGAGNAVKTAYPDAANVVGFIRGSKHPERFMVVSAHYDHLGVRKDVLYPGADDNASGVASMLAIAAAFRASPPENTIVFAAFDAEELGLRGAEAFVKALPFARDKLRLNLNLDMVSRNEANTIWAAGAFHHPALKPLVNEAAGRSTVTVKLGHDKPLIQAAAMDDWTGSSDHGVFHHAGVPFLYFGVDDHPDYHQPGDTADKIDPTFFARVASLLVDVATVADKQLDSVK